MPPAQPIQYQISDFPHTQKETADHADGEFRIVRLRLSQADGRFVPVPVPVPVPDAERPFGLDS
jgi:hypothetical protein